MTYQEAYQKTTGEKYSPSNFESVQQEREEVRKAKMIATRSGDYEAGACLRQREVDINVSLNETDEAMEMIKKLKSDPRGFEVASLERLQEIEKEIEKLV